MTLGLGVVTLDLGARERVGSRCWVAVVVLIDLFYVVGWPFWDLPNVYPCQSSALGVFLARWCSAEQPGSDQAKRLTCYVDYRSRVSMNGRKKAKDQL